MTTHFLFLDDIRNPPQDGENWTVLRTVDDAWSWLVRNWYMGNSDDLFVMSLDHDLGEGVPTGYDFVNKIEAAMMTAHDFRPKLEVVVHSGNPVGAENMARAIRSIYRILEG